jgi:hypothetical protein
VTLIYRWLPPIFVFGMAAYVWNYNQTHTGSMLLFPLLNEVPSLKGDFQAQADASWKIFTALGGVLALWSLWDQIRRPRNSDDEQQEV